VGSGGEGGGKVAISGIGNNLCWGLRVWISQADLKQLVPYVILYTFWNC